MTDSRNTSGVLSGGFRVGRIFGIELVVDFSLIIIFGLITMTLGAGLIPRWHPEWSVAFSWVFAVAAAIAFFGSVLLHELSHALVGRAQGIPVKRITLFLFGGLAQMDREAASPGSELVMAAVGPLVSIALGVVATIGGALLAPTADVVLSDPQTAVRALGPAATLLLWLGPVNLMLGVFNLIPGFPLDGGRVMRAALWWATGSIETATRWASLMGRLFAWVLMGAGVMMTFGIHIPVLGTGFLNGLWLLMIGWFLNNAARASFVQLMVQRALADVSVTDVMRSRVETVSPELSVAALVHDHLMNGEQHAFPVMDHGRLVGLVAMSDVRKVQPNRWANVPVSHIMTPRSELSTVEAETNANQAMLTLAQRGVDQLPVVHHGELRGLVRRQDVIKWLSLHDTFAGA